MAEGVDTPPGYSDPDDTPPGYSDPTKAPAAPINPWLHGYMGGVGQLALGAAKGLGTMGTNLYSLLRAGLPGGGLGPPPVSESVKKALVPEQGGLEPLGKGLVDAGTMLAVPAEAGLAGAAKAALASGGLSKLQGHGNTEAALTGVLGAIPSGLASAGQALRNFGKPLSALEGELKGYQTLPNIQSGADAVTLAKNTAYAAAKAEAAKRFGPLAQIPWTPTAKDFQDAPELMDLLRNAPPTSGGFTVKTLQDIRSQIGEAIPNLPSQTSPEVGRLKLLYGKLSDMMDGAAKAAGKGDELEEAQSWYRDKVAKLFFHTNEHGNSIGSMLSAGHFARKTNLPETITPGGNPELLRDFKEMMEHLPKEQSALGDQALKAIQQRLVAKLVPDLPFPGGPQWGVEQRLQSLGSAAARGTKGKFWEQASDTLDEAFGEKAPVLKDAMKIAQDNALSQIAMSKLGAMESGRLGVGGGWGQYSLLTKAWKQLFFWAATSPDAPKVGSLITKGGKGLAPGFDALVDAYQARQRQAPPSPSPTLVQ